MISRTYSLIHFVGVWLTLFCAATVAADETSLIPHAPLDQLFLLHDTKTARISTADKNGGNVDFLKDSPAPGQTITVADVAGAGVVRRIYFALAGADRMRWRKLILRMYWDGHKDPDVEVPLGDFFGAGLGTLRHFRSAVVSINPSEDGEGDYDGVTSYFPMPYEKGARITVENDSDLKEFILFYHVEYEQYGSGELPSNTGRFHAQWRRVAKTPISAGTHKKFVENLNDKNLTGDNNYVILDTNGQGSFVGFFLTVDNTQGGWYGEGDDMIFVDGQNSGLTYAGTGHEEVFDDGCCPTKEWWGPYTGFYLIENRNGDYSGKNQMYRFSVNNPVHFQKSIRATIEHGSGNNYDSDYTSTAFWYQKDPQPAFPSLPPAKERLPNWPVGVQEAMDAELALSRYSVFKNRAEADDFIRTSAGTPFKTPPDRIIVASKQDAKKLADLASARQKAFHSFNFPEYIRDVKATKAIFKTYAVSP